MGPHLLSTVEEVTVFASACARFDQQFSLGSQAMSVGSFFTFLFVCFVFCIFFGLYSLLNKVSVYASFSDLRSPPCLKIYVFKRLSVSLLFDIKIRFILLYGVKPTVKVPQTSLPIT